MYRLFSLLIVLVIMPVVFAQTDYRKRADNYFKYYNYERALKDYKRLYRKKKEDADLLRKIIECYLKDNGLREQALPYIDKLLDVKPNDAEAYYSKATALFHGHRFEEALTALQYYKSSGAGGPEKEKKIEVLVHYIENAKMLISHPLNVDFINLGKQVNTTRNELSAFVTYDEQTLFYTSDKRYNSYAGIYYFNVCVSEMTHHRYQKGKTIGSYVNSIFDEMVAGIDPSGEMLFVFHNRDGEDEMGYAKYKGRYRFDPMLEFGHPLDQKGGEYGVWMTTGQDTIYYSAESENGTTDLYYAMKLPDGNWGYGRPIKGAVNTPYNENFPVLSDDGKRLYFSSDNENSMGGYDLYVSEKNTASGEWGKPVNVGYPINDTYDNFTISWVNGKRHAYVSSIRPEGYGYRDIYKVVFKDTEPYNSVLKCDIRLKVERKEVIPAFTPTVTVTDTLHNLVGSYKVMKDSADCLMVLTPGYYLLKIESDQTESFEQLLEIPEKWYDGEADRIKCILYPATESADKKP
ncbi:MAG: PD40 domain-containing protein [Marinilabiliaceae bacterium]|nr:PD40 domain-containing protein [Marinilabiliaceae bacterium]